MLLLCAILVAAAPAPSRATPDAGAPRGAAGPARSGADAGSPSASEMAKLYFLAGDVRQAVDWCKRGLAREPAVCRPMIQALAEYGYLASKRDAFTPAEARAFLEWDRAISKDVPSKLTEPTIERFVTRPLARARLLAAGDRAQAERLVRGVLEVEPQNVEALALADELAGRDGGRAVSPDAGRADAGTSRALQR